MFDGSLAGVGFYTAPEAERLIGVPARSLRRWMRGYRYAGGNSPPLWTPEVPQAGAALELSFADLMEARFVQAFLAAGLSPQSVRLALTRAREIFRIERPFATQRFRTDGRTIFLDLGRGDEEPALLDLKKSAYAFRDIVAPSFKDTEFEAGRVARWWPRGASRGVLVDPARAFGRPVMAKSGVPTNVLADAYRVTGSLAVAAKDFEVSLQEVREAVAFEERAAA